MLKKFGVSVLTVTMLLPALSAASISKQSELFVLATLYKRHEKVPFYDLKTLRKIIEAINPDVMVLDVTPTELREDKVHASKIEYTEVVFPMIKNSRYRVYPAEPSEPMFSEIVNAVIEAHNTLKTAKPDQAAALNQFTVDTYAALMAYWRTPADVNSNVTDLVLSGKKRLEVHLAGTAEMDRRWNHHTVEVTLRAIKENPGKRVLVLAGIENCYQIREALGRTSKIDLVDMERWLRNNEQLFRRAAILGLENEASVVSLTDATQL